ncbi:MAG: 30S ribosomal protein S2 [Candidatus Pacebacteria bacterium]|nr:30S ribosomal protein S2 [Candidatus Paceibacterota bacterium]
MSDDLKSSPLSKELFAVGAHFGYSRTRRHPSTAKYLFATKNKVDIIDIEKTEVMLEKATAFMHSLGEKGKTVVFVGTKPEAKESTRLSADSLGLPFVTSRWVGGILTNFPEIKKRLNRLEELRAAKISGDLAKKYTKKEQLLIAREVAKMEDLFSGIVSLKGLPDALVIVDPKKEMNAFLEAKKLGIPTIAIASTDCDITTIEYPILANDASRASIEYIIKLLADSYKQN